MDPQQGPPQPDLLIGQTIGNYLVTQKLGEGGMGAVYLAEHPSIGKKVALKVLHSEFSTNPEVANRFFHEAKAVNDIGHPNIVDIVDFGIIQAGIGREQLVYFIMEYLAGMTLSQIIRVESPLPPERALTIALQVADALSASHKCGIVHRDLKPDNIILIQRGRERDFVKLLDFGIAKLTGGSAMGSHRTRTGIVMGTPAYMSPEQCEGRDSVDLRTDVYALGIVLYEMLTGRVPFIGEGYGEILVQHLTQRPRPPSQYRMLPAHVESVVLKALEKRADLRYPTMEELMRAMSDPVGYVESHGGVAGFLQRQLVPSSAPVTMSLRLTPAPLTPLPGTMIAPMPPGTAPGMNAPTAPGRTGPGMTGPGMTSPGRTGHPVTGHGNGMTGPGIATPSPTTLGSASGQMHAPRSKAGFIIAALLVIAAAVAGIIVVVGKDQVGDGSGSGVASNDLGSNTVAGTDPGSDKAGTGTTGTTDSAGTTGAGTTGTGATGTGTTGAGTTGTDTGSSGTTGTGTAPDPTIKTGADTGSSGTTGTGTTGTDTTGTGSDTTAGTAPGSSAGRPATVELFSEIDVDSTPHGGRIYVDGVDTGKTTPGKLSLPKNAGETVSITVKLKGYKDATLKSIDARKSSTQKLDLVKIKTSSNSPPSTGKNGGKDKGSAAPQKPPDRDGLLRPSDD